MIVNREEFLGLLTQLMPAVTRKVTIQQSTCFAFMDEMAITFDGYLCMRHKIPLKLEGAVEAAPLHKWLGKINDEQVNIKVDGERLKFTVPGKGISMKMQNQVLLPLSQIEEPGKWVPIENDFCPAAAIVQDVAKGDVQVSMAHVHIHPQRLESYCKNEIIQWDMDTGVKEPCLVDRECLNSIVELGISHISVTPSWVHFKNEEGLMVSARKAEGKFPDLGNIFEVEGEPISFPRVTAEAAELTGIFSSENRDFNKVLVQLKKGKMRVNGYGNSGDAWQVNDINYKGQPVQFLMSPDLLQKLCKEHADSSCILGKDRLLVNGGSFKYLVKISKPKKEK